MKSRRWLRSCAAGTATSRCCGCRCRRAATAAGTPRDTGADSEYAHRVPPEGYDTAVVLPLRDAAARELAERLLAAVDDALLLTLPGLAEIVVETPGQGVRTLSRHVEGPYVEIEDEDGNGARSTRRWRVAGESGIAGQALLADRPVEERLRPAWSVTWAVPVERGRARTAADGAVCARSDAYGRAAGSARAADRVVSRWSRPGGMSPRAR